jgi:hopanoid biosynthesis associated RND transporter like protein HpnN
MTDVPGPVASPGPSRDVSSWLGSAAARLVAFSTDHAFTAIGASILLGAISIWFAVGHFAMTTDTNQLLSSSLDWRQRQASFDAQFPNQGQIVVVIDGKTPELAEQAAAALTARLTTEGPLFSSIERPDATPFFKQNGLLFLSAKDVQSNMAKLISAQPFLGPLATDPSLRGLTTTLSTFATGLAAGQASVQDLQTPASKLADALQDIEAGKPAFFSWETLVAAGKPDPHQLRKVILVDPRLDFAKLEPGSDASHDIRKAIASLGLDETHGVRVRLTGPVPLEDEEFATLAERWQLIAGIAFCAILTMLWLAVRSVKTIIAILVTTLVGLAAAAAFGLLIFHRFNLISVAFIPLFVGLGIDFGIQFSVRVRAEQLGGANTVTGLKATGVGMGRSLTLAAAAIASGFLAFGPTAYIGVSQLGVIAGCGLIFALLLSLSLLPALLRLVPPKPPRVAEKPFSLHALDGFMLGHRRLVVGTGVLAALGSAALLPQLHFDFNPIHLRSAKVESVSTLLDLMKDPDESANTLETLAPSLPAAQPIAARFAALPPVYGVRTLQSFIPTDQPEKLAAIGDASTLLDLTLNPIAVNPPPTDAEVQASLAATATQLASAAGTNTTPAAGEVRRLATALDRLAKGSPALRQQATDALIPGLNTLLDQTRNSLQAQPVTLDTLPADLKRQWLLPDGRARISVIPKGDSNNNAVLSKFTNAVRTVDPNVVGTPIAVQESGKTIVAAFIEAGILSFIAITILLFIVLKRVRDVAITMAPIVLTGLLTMGSCVLLGQPLNFANIIALPLLFGIGVAFHIYFVMAWRSGGEHLIESSLTRAVFFSALTTATGFGSLWASSHPGTASMGKLLMISLVWTLVSALLFQPALMGPPPKDAVKAE